MIKDKYKNASSVGLESTNGIITEIERYAIHDGPGIGSVIFLKGCDLKCKWCSNPETQKKYIEMAYFKEKCIGCGHCLENCPHNAIENRNGVFYTKRNICEKYCFGKIDKFSCTLQCYSKARQSIGEVTNVLKIYKEIIRDYNFFKASGGGVTLSGGEPMLSPDFTYSLIRYCKEKWIDTAIETNGNGLLEDYMEILPFLNTMFIDLKHTNSVKHKEWTGCENTVNLENIKFLSRVTSKYNFKMFIRIPIIPYFNDSEQELEEIGNFIKNNCKGITGVELLPYHKLGRGKYESIGLKYSLNYLQTPSKDKIQGLNSLLNKSGVTTCQF